MGKKKSYKQIIAMIKGMLKIDGKSVCLGILLNKDGCKCRDDKIPERFHVLKKAFRDSSDKGKFKEFWEWLSSLKSITDTPLQVMPEVNNFDILCA